MEAEQIYMCAEGKDLNRILEVEGARTIYYGENWKGALSQSDLQKFMVLEKHADRYALICSRKDGVLMHADIEAKSQMDALEKALAYTHIKVGGNN